MRFLSNLACFLAGLIVALAVSGHAEPVWEIGAGRTQYKVREHCALWQQCNPALETNDELRSWGYQLGARFPLDRAVSIRASWVYLGHFYANNTWVGDGNSEHFPLRCPEDQDDCRRRGKMSGVAYGASLGPVLHDQWGAWHGEIEGGLFVFRSNMKLNDCPEDSRPTNDVGCGSFNRMWGVHQTWYAGFGAGRGAWTLNWRVYWNVYEQGNHMPGGEPGLTGGHAQTLFLNYAF